MENVQAIDQSWLGSFQAGLGDDLAASSVVSYLRTLRAFCRWAAELGWIGPLRFRIPRLQDDQIAGGEPIDGAQFQRLLDAVPLVVEGQRVAAYQRALRGLWLSGFRLSELCLLAWDSGPIEIRDLDSDLPLVAFSTQKSGKPQLWPIPPDWADHLRASEYRCGPVYELPGAKMARYGAISSVGKLLARIGERSGVTVRSPAGIRCVSAQDLRRSFAMRWTLASNGNHELVRQLTRHASHRTTRRFYAIECAASLSRQMQEISKFFSSDL